MPPVRKTVRVQQIFDGKEEIDLRPMGVNLLYFPKFLDNKDASSIFRALMLSKAFTQHQYINRFKKQITPHRLTHAHVPKDRRYRFLGQNLNRSENEIFVQHFGPSVDAQVFDFKHCGFVSLAVASKDCYWLRTRSRVKAYIEPPSIH